MNNNNTVQNILHRTALQAPSSSGVYMWRDSQETVIYVGKAKNLKSRLTSYFSGRKDIKTRILISRATSIEYITTANEYEAFLLENNLIKQYTPRYNINLKDGKSYPVIRITHEKFPRMFKTRHILHDGSIYFGPFPDVGALDTFIDVMYHLYPIRHCKTFRKRDVPCMYYHIGQCKAPCCGKTSAKSYNEIFGEIAQLLEGKGKETQKKLTDAMKTAALELNFEKAARIRDGLRALMIMENQNVVEGFDGQDRDYIAHNREGELVSFTVLKIRNGKLLGRDNYRTVSLNEDNELLPEFMNAYYTKKNMLPPHIYIPTRDGLDFMEKWLTDTFHADTEITPVSDEMEYAKRHQAAMNMAAENAHEDIIRRLRERGDMPAIEELKNILHMDRLPVRIEGFDIAHINGKFPVASLISFYNGNPDKKNYRYFRLKTTEGIIDDFASMREAASRRYTRLVNEQADLPDLILIDGGIGQVNAVRGVLDALSLDIPIAGLAKRDEEIYRPGDSTPISLPKRSDALRLLQRVRDETHRFATSRNQKLRTKENTVSSFSELPHVGTRRARILMNSFSTLDNLAATEEAPIAQALHIRAEEAAEILMAAKNMLEQRSRKQKETKKMFQTAATTTQKAATTQHISNLAEQALDVAETEPDYAAQDSDRQEQDS